MSDFDSSDIMLALKATSEYFDNPPFWINPWEMEKRIFYQFLISNTCYQLKISKEELYDFWEDINTAISSVFGEEKFNSFARIRNERFEEYSSIYQEFSATPCFKTGNPPRLQSEITVIENLCFSVFSNVERNYSRPVNFIQRNLEFADSCRSIHSFHRKVMSGEIK